MSDESTVMESGSDTGVSQQDFVNDFFDESSYELVNDDGSTISETNAQTAKTPQNQNQNQSSNESLAQKQEQQPVQVDQQQTQQQPGEDYKKNPLVASFYGEDGSLKDDVLDFFSIGKEQGFSYQRPVVENKQQDPESAPDDRPEWQRRWEEDRAYEQKIRTNLLTPVNRIEELLKEGYDPAQVIAHVKADYESKVQEHLREREYRARYESQNTQAEERAKQAEMAELKPKSTANIGLIANEVGGFEKFQQLMFSPEIGGPIMNFLFDLQNPDKVDLPQDKLEAAIGEWWMRFSSNMNNLRLASNMARAVLQQQMWPQIVERIRSGAINQQQQNNRATMPRSTGLTAAPATAKSEPVDDLQRYLNGPLDEV